MYPRRRRDSQTLTLFAVREGKRQAESVEDLETAEPKKPKIDLGVEQTAASPIEIDDDVADDPTTSTLEVIESVTIASTNLSDSIEPSKQTRGAKTKGSDIHFKENPYTFLSPDDPVLQACMYVPSHDHLVVMHDPTI